MFLLLNKATGLQLATFWKRTPLQIFCNEFRVIFQKSFFTEYLKTTDYIEITWKVPCSRFLKYHKFRWPEILPWSAELAIQVSKWTRSVVKVSQHRRNLITTRRLLNRHNRTGSAMYKLTWNFYSSLNSFKRGFCHWIIFEVFSQEGYD